MSANNVAISPKRFSCFLIGATGLLTKCAETIIKSGHTIYGIISGDPDVQNWAAKRQIPCPDLEPDAIYALLSGKSFDYLFSIVNQYIFAPETLSLPQKGAINYHDAPLPKYAGSHATMWAICNQEKNHAVSWHVMKAGVDSGAILKQAPVNIAPDESVYSLDIKCSFTALKCFKELLPELAHGNPAVRQQNLNERTFFRYYARPAAGCVLSLQQSAAAIDAFCRSLNHANYLNSIGTPKLWIDGRFFLLPKITVMGESAPAPSGAIVSINPDSLIVATETQNIKIDTIYTVDGKPLTIPELVGHCQLRRPSRFTTPDAQTAAQIGRCYNQTCKYEQYWVKRLSALQPLDAFFTSAPTSGAHEGEIKQEFTLPDQLRSANQLSETLLSSIALILAQTADTYSYDIGFCVSDPEFNRRGVANLFARTVPLKITLDPTQTSAQIAPALLENINTVRKNKTYMRDVLYRYPLLRKTAATIEKTLTVRLTLVKTLDNDIFAPGAGLNIVIPTEGPKGLVLYNPAIIQSETVDQLLYRLNRLD
jgi:methionyl-tRNA formyltransferase